MLWEKVSEQIHGLWEKVSEQIHNNNNNDFISIALFHVRHAQLC